MAVALGLERLLTWARAASPAPLARVPPCWPHPLLTWCRGGEVPAAAASRQDGGECPSCAATVTVYTGHPGLCWCGPHCRVLRARCRAELSRAARPTSSTTALHTSRLGALGRCNPQHGNTCPMSVFFGSLAMMVTKLFCSYHFMSCLRSKQPSLVCFITLYKLSEIKIVLCTPKVSM